MYYVIQEDLFREENYHALEEALQRMKLPYEVVKVPPFVEDFEFKTGRKDVFPFGSLKMARISAKYKWVPGSLMTQNHDFEIYSQFYKENMLNYDSKIYKFGDSFKYTQSFFVRPCKDTKVFTGKVIRFYGEWEEFRDHLLTSGHTTVLDKDTKIQVCSEKKIQKEIRFWIVKGDIVTGSQYKLGRRVVYDSYVDEDAVEFCKKMVELFEVADAFVMDVCLSNDKWKIVECGCVNCAGFYLADMQRLVNSLEVAFG